MHKPQIALFIPDTLTALGLQALIKRLMPGAEVCLFSDCNLTAKTEQETFFHFFTTTQFLLAHPHFFLQRRHKTIVLIQGDESTLLPQGFHTLNVCQKEELLVRDFLRLAQNAHNAKGTAPEAVQRAQMPHKSPTLLTPREHDVLHGIVVGLRNKEIADRLGISLATVISHRKNITLKLDAKSVSALTIYAVAHGIVKTEEI